MTVDIKLSRRAALAGMASLPIIAANTSIAQAKAPMQPISNARFARYKLGDFEITTLLDASRVQDKPQEIFGMNVSADEFAKASDENLIPADKTRFFFTPTLVNTGNELVLFDTGLGGENGNIKAAIEAADYSPDQIDIVVLTHMHPDHIGGLMTGSAPTFANASYVTGEVEYGFWTTKGAGNRVGEMVAKLVVPQAEKMTFLKGGGTVASGITAVEAYGHTPGHMTYMLESNGKQMLLGGDFANHYVWSLAYPDWEVKFDADKAAAAATRRKLLDMLAADKIPFVGYHMPFPAVGYVIKTGNGYHYAPETYQLSL